MKNVILAAVVSVAMAFSAGQAMADNSGDHDVGKEFLEEVFGKKVTPRSQWVLHRWSPGPCDSPDWKVRVFECDDLPN